MKLFNLGLPKSGTSTLDVALSKSGWRSAHWITRDPQRYVGRSLYRNYLAGRDPLADFRDYDAITQADLVTRTASYWPQMDFAILRKVEAYHPGCKFLLLTRDAGKIASSMTRWSDFQDRLNDTGAPGLPQGHARSERSLRAWIEGHFETVRQHFDGREDFLELDIGDTGASEKLSDFVGTEIAWWGHANANPEVPPRASA